MPDSRPLKALQTSLAGALSLRRAHHEPVWGEPKAMTAALKGVKQAFGGADDSERPARDDLVAAVRGFFRSRQISSFTELKYVCYGVTVPVDDDGQRVIDRRLLLDRLIELVQARRAQPKQFRRCYQGLLSGYFGFEHEVGDSATAGQNWLTLRGFLGSQLKPVADAAHARGRRPDWLEVLAQHGNLLGDKPCARYADGLRRGDRSELAAVCAGLGIEPGSWVWHEAVMAYVTQVVGLGEPTFKLEIPQMLAVIDGQHSDLKLPAPVARDAAALVVVRYEQCKAKPEHGDLRDVSIRRIGNPWLERAAWDAAVKSEPARQMIESWLKRRLIKDFFELLARDGAAEERRLNYWLKWEPKIDDMWFVLGVEARQNRTSAFLAVLGRMEGRARHLIGSTSDANNAFIMRIGSRYVVEFGVTNNACYVFPVSSSQLELDAKRLDIYALKHQPGRKQLSHAWQWEAKFDHELSVLLATHRPGPQVDTVKSTPTPQPPRAIQPAGRSASGALLKALMDDRPRTQSSGKGIWPEFTRPKTTSKSVPVDVEPSTSRPPSNPTWLSDRKVLDARGMDLLEVQCRNLGMTIEDNRKKGGALWLRLPESGIQPGFITTKLIESYGFRFAKGKGYYLEEDN